MESLDRSIEYAGTRAHGLRVQQAKHDAFAVKHQHEFDERRLVAQAIIARRLKLRIGAIADPSAAVLEVLGAPPASQRDRLRWEHAVESIVLLAEESGRPLPDHARTVTELLGGPPSSPLDRFQHERVAKVVNEATSSPERELGSRALDRLRPRHSRSLAAVGDDAPGVERAPAARDDTRNGVADTDGQAREPGRAKHRVSTPARIGRARSGPLTTRRS